jgi:hypothetical protein
MAARVVKLCELSREEVPEELRPETYFDFRAHRFAHEALFRRDDVNSVYAAILAIGDYAKNWLKETMGRKRAEVSGLTVLTDAAGRANAQTIGDFEVILEPGAVFEPACVIGSTDRGVRNAVYVESGARILGSVIYLAEGSIYIGTGTILEPGVGVKGPTIIGRDCEIRQGAYLRGNCILGDECTIRAELKNVVMMDKANFPHPSYAGDSICGYMTHFGNQVTAANLGIYEGIRERDKRKNLVVTVNGVGYDLGNPKMGVCMGDFSQLGCNSVPDPGTFLRPYTIAYSLTRLKKGFYGPREVLKNKPMEHGVIERAPLESLD